MPSCSIQIMALATSIRALLIRQACDAHLFALSPFVDVVFSSLVSRSRSWGPKWHCREKLLHKLRSFE